MKTFPIKKIYLIIVFLVQTAMLPVVNAQQGRSTKKLPPDIGQLMDSVNRYVGKGDLRTALDFLSRGNAELRSSELYCYGSFFASRADLPDLAAEFLDSAIDAGMDNPNILGKDPVLDTLRNSKDWPRLRNRLERIAADLKRPENFAVHSGPVDEFWNAYDKARSDRPNAKKIYGDYILHGSDPVRDFYSISYKDVDAIVSETLGVSDSVYISARDAVTARSLAPIEKGATEMMLRLHKIYPTTVFPKVYVMMGIGRSGGTLTNLGLFIGAEKFIDGSGNLDKGMKNTILHELVHFQQNYRDSENSDTVLGRSVQEGVCDFIVGLCGESYTEGKVVADFDRDYDKKYVLGEFKKDMFTKDLSKWMYNGDKGENPKMPPDMGYKLGKAICASYYDNSTDKEKAVFELLNTDNFGAILSGSDFGYLAE